MNFRFDTTLNEEETKAFVELILSLEFFEVSDSGDVGIISLDSTYFDREKFEELREMQVSAYSIKSQIK